MAIINFKTHVNGLEYLEIDSDYCQAEVYFQGAQVTHFQPKDQAPLLFVSSADPHQVGTDIRGGAPICWPWFGIHQNAEYPAHGFARKALWQLVSTKIEHEVVKLRFELPPAQFNRALWPHNTLVAVEVELAETLTIHLINTNLEPTPIELTQAIHTYFAIDDIHQLEASGFEGAKYIEFGEGPFPQRGDSVRFDRETDRVYTQLAPMQYLKTGKGIIEVSREHSQSAVLWNPWVDKSKRLARFHDQDYLHMVCLEAANVGEDKITIAPQQSHRLTTRIGWAKTGF